MFLVICIGASNGNYFIFYLSISCTDIDHLFNNIIELNTACCLNTALHSQTINNRLTFGYNSFLMRQYLWQYPLIEPQGYLYLSSLYVLYRGQSRTSGDNFLYQKNVSTLVLSGQRTLFQKSYNFFKI